MPEPVEAQGRREVAEAVFTALLSAIATAVGTALAQTVVEAAKVRLARLSEPEELR